MTCHFDNDAERVTMVKRTRKSVTVILIITLIVLAYSVYQLIK